MTLCLRNMRIELTIVVLLSLTVGCATRKGPADPFSCLDAKDVKAVAVGEYKSTGNDKPDFEFVPAFTITDASTVQELTQLLIQSPRIEPAYPGIGCLSWQQFLDGNNRPVAVTCIINWNNLITIDRPGSTHSAEIPTATCSKPFCKAIYDLMQKNWPGAIQEQQKHYHEVGQALENLLFDGKVNNRDTTTKSTVPSEGAPSDVQ